MSASDQSHRYDTYQLVEFGEVVSIAGVPIEVGVELVPVDPYAAACIVDAAGPLRTSTR